MNTPEQLFIGNPGIAGLLLTLGIGIAVYWTANRMFKRVLKDIYKPSVYNFPIGPDKPLQDMIVKLEPPKPPTNCRNCGAPPGEIPDCPYCGTGTTKRKIRLTDAEVETEAVAEETKRSSLEIEQKLLAASPKFIELVYLNETAKVTAPSDLFPDLLSTPTPGKPETL